MKWLLVVSILVAVAAAVAALAALIGSRLPRAHAASREARLAALPDAVWKAIGDVDRYGSWRSDVSRIERLPDRAGKMTWIEHGGNGRITYVVERAEPPRLLVVRIADPELPFGGTWTYEIWPDPGGSVVKITEAGEIYNPLFRFMARFVFGYEATLKRYVAALEKKFGANTAAAGGSPQPR